MRRPVQAAFKVPRSPLRASSSPVSPSCAAATSTASHLVMRYASSRVVSSSAPPSSPTTASPNSRASARIDDDSPTCFSKQFEADDCAVVPRSRTHRARPFILRAERPSPNSQNAQAANVRAASRRRALCGVLVAYKIFRKSLRACPFGASLLDLRHASPPSVKRCQVDVSDKCCVEQQGKSGNTCMHTPPRRRALFGRARSA